MTTNNLTAVQAPQYQGRWIAYYDDRYSSPLYAWGKSRTEAMDNLKRRTEKRIS